MKIRNVMMAALLFAVTTNLGCGGAAEEAGTDWEQLNARAASWGVYDLRRPNRTAEMVLGRTAAIASVVLERDDLPDSGLLDPGEIELWSTAAQADRYREAAYRFTWDQRDISVRYRPASDRLTVIAKDVRFTPSGIGGGPPDIGAEEALTRARRCLRLLETRGVVSPGEFNDKPSYQSVVETSRSGGQSWVEQYSFVFTPTLDGLPLLSAEVVVGVAAGSGACRRITVGGQVDARRLRDASVVLSDETAAREALAQKLLQNAVGVSDALVRGRFAYYLALDQQQAVVSPNFVGHAATLTEPGGYPTISRSQLYGLDLANPDAALTDYLSHE